MIILCDVDCVVADLMPEWIRLYNNDFSDNLCVDAITEWDMTKFVVPACGTKIYTYLNYDHLYDNVTAIKDSWYCLEYLRGQGNRVVFVTSGIYCVGKFQWLEKNMFSPGQWGKDFIVANDKSLIKGDVLIDDGVHNIESFSPERSILFDQPWNKNFEESPRAFSWMDVVNLIDERY